jgi:signal peptidase I
MVYWFIDINEEYNYTAAMGKELSLRENSGKGTVGKAIAGAFIAALVMKFFFFDFMIAEGNSMVPAIKPGTILLVCKAFYGLRLPGSGNYLLHWGIPKTDDVVVFYTPLGEIAVKRCGDRFSNDTFYALGDNSSQSYDSRSYGPVPDNHVIGKVLGIK